MTQPVVLRHGYTRNPEAASAALRYYQARPRGPHEPPREIFTREKEITREEALRMLRERQPVGRFLCHRLMLSLSEETRPESLPQLTRHSMRELEKVKGCELSWLGVEHRNTDHRHVHILLCGGGRVEGHTVEVRLDRADYSLLKEEALAYCRTEARLQDVYDRVLSQVHAEPASRWHDADRSTAADLEHMMGDDRL